MPLASVIIPVYNAAAFLQEALESVFSQSFQDFEVLAVNDGSTDNSLEILQAFDNPKLRIIDREENGGIVAALNDGIEAATGKYIIRMDSDDICLPGRFKKQIDLMESHPEVGVSSFHIKVFGAKEQTWKVPLKHENIHAGLLFSSTFNHPATIIRKSVLDEHELKYRDTFMHMEDYDLWYRMKDITSFANLDEILLHYRVLDHNVTVKNRKTATQRLNAFHRHILKDLGIQATDMELILHSGKMELSNDNVSTLIPAYHTWLQKLIKANQDTKVFPEKALQKKVNALWQNLFFRAADLGWKGYRTYKKVDPKNSAGQLKYFVRKRISKLMGRS